MEGWDFAVEGRFEPQARERFQPQAQEAGEFGRRSRAQGRKKGVLPQEGRARSIPGRCRAHKGAFSPPEILDGRSPDRTRNLNVCPHNFLNTLGSTIHSGFILSSPSLVRGKVL